MKTERMTFVGRRVRAKAQRRESAMRASGPATRPVWSGLRAHKASNRTAKLGWGRPGGFWIKSLHLGLKETGPLRAVTGAQCRAWQQQCTRRDRGGLLSMGAAGTAREPIPGTRP